MGISWRSAPARAPKARLRISSLVTQLSLVGAAFATSAMAALTQSTVVSQPATVAAAPLPSALTEVNPDVVTPSSSLKYGGRIESLSVNPVNPQIILAASELGGLWRSNDGAQTWFHVDAVPLTRMYDVKFAAGDPSLVIATGDNDGASPSRGGIWRSTDGGSTWSRPATGTSGASCGGNPQPGAHWFDIAGTTPGSLTVAVGTDCGISVSGDSGATWTQQFASGPANARYWDAKARVVGGNVQLDVCGDGGFTRSSNGGGSFSAYVVDGTALFGATALGAPPCRIATAPGDANTVFISSFKRNTVAPACSSLLLMATNANAAAPTWTDLNACGNNNRNGRFPFVVTHPDHTNPTTQFQVYFGNNTRTNVQTCTYTPTTCAAGPWGLYDGNHPHNGTDPTGVAFDPTTPGGCPAFVSGDGGVAAPSDCSTSPGSFTMMNTRLNALDALSIAGTVYPASHTSLYFGTQDNGIFLSTNDGGAFNRFNYDIYGLNADHAGDTAQNPASQVLWRDAAYSAIPNNHVNLAHEDLSSNAFWSAQPPLPPGFDPSDNYSATQFGYGRFAFITPDIAPAAPPAPQPNWKMYVTTNSGGAWTQMGGNAPGSPVGNPQASGTAANPVFYQVLSVNGANQLYRLAGPMDSTAVYTNVTGNLQNPTTFAVHPSNPLLLYANDAGANRVMRSTDGGATWTADTNLTALTQRGGLFPFTNGGSQIAAFGFDGNTNTVMAGANNSGVFASPDGGASWFSVRGGENIPRIAGFFFDERSGSIYTSSGGRGMWRISLPKADLSITKTSTPNPVVAGNQLTYTLTVSSDPTSPTTAGSITVSDSLPSDVTFLTSNDGCTEAPPGQLTCPVPNLAPGASFSFTVTVLVHSGTVLNTGGAKTIINTASVATGDTIDTNPSNNVATAATTVTDSADLQATKLCKPDTTVYAGTPITCTVFIDNHGPSDARNVSVDDVMLSNGVFTISNVLVTPGPTSCTTSTVTGGQKLSCAVGNIPAASTTATGRVTISYQVAANDGQNLDNVATVRSDTPDPNPSNNQATVNLTITSVADLGLTKLGPASAVAGQPITWTLSVLNSGPSSASNVAITDTVPAGVTITSVSTPVGACVTGAAGDPTQPAVCTLGSLAAGATSPTMTIVATVNPQTTGILHNNARVSSATFDNNSSNDLAHSDTVVTVQADIAVTVAATPNPAVAGTPLSYAVTVSNNGPSTATGIVLTDTLPGGVTFVSTGGVGTCGFQTNTNTVTCQLPNLDPGQSEIVYINTTVKPSTLGSIVDTATVTANGADPVSSNNTSTITTTVTAVADLAIVLSSDLLVYKPSTTIHYQITVTNAGPSDALSVTVVQTLPLTRSSGYVSNNLPGCPPPVGVTFTCGVGTIPAGGSVTFQVNFFVQGNQKLMTSSATVSSPTSDPTTPDTSIRVVTVK